MIDLCDGNRLGTPLRIVAGLAPITLTLQMIPQQDEGSPSRKVDLEFRAVTSRPSKTVLAKVSAALSPRRNLAPTVEGATKQFQTQTEVVLKDVDSLRCSPWASKKS